MILLNRPNEAEAEARTAVALDGGNFTAQYLLGFLLARRPTTRDQAAEHLLYAARTLPEAHLTLAAMYRALGQERLATLELDRYQQKAVPPHSNK
jgi:hypothetical protein